MKFFVRTYGCQMNVADSNEMGRHLKARGLEETFDQDEASVMLVNTCTVREHAEHRAFSEVGRLKKWKVLKPGRKLVVTGCAAERTRDYLENRFPHIDLIVGAKNIGGFENAVSALLERRDTDENLDYAVPSISETVSSFVTIMRGCNYSCTYCIVPSVRGRESYHPMEQVLAEIRDRIAEGAREITLLGQTVNSWHRYETKGRDNNFADLLKEAARVDGVDRIRFMSPHPYYMSDRIIDTMASVPAVCEYLHLPVQSGSDPILKKMQRNYTRQHYIALADKMRKTMPGMTLSTDIIVGFPGETEEDFLQTLSFVEEIRFDWGFIFKYSPREGTPAAGFECHPQEIVEERHQRCLGVLERISTEQRSRLPDTVHEVLVEEGNLGRTRTNYKVRIDGHVVPGDLVSVRINNVERATLEGVRVSREPR